jgi:hypothetical protein
VNPVYLQPIDTTCQRPGCKRPAAVEVKGSPYISYGKFCETHGQDLVEEMNSSPPGKPTNSVPSATDAMQRIWGSS